MPDRDLHEAILADTEESRIGDMLLEGWQLGLYDARLTDDGGAEWCLSEKAADLERRGMLEEYVEREMRGIDVEASAIPSEPIRGDDS